MQQTESARFCAQPPTVLRAQWVVMYARGYTDSVRRLVVEPLSTTNDHDTAFIP
jgi:hypothetical protein